MKKAVARCPTTRRAAIYSTGRPHKRSARADARAPIVQRVARAPIAPPHASKRSGKRSGREATTKGGRPMNAYARQGGSGRFRSPEDAFRRES